MTRQFNQAELVFLYSTSEPEYKGYVRVGHIPAEPSLSLNLPPDSDILKRMSTAAARKEMPSGARIRLLRCSLSISTIDGHISSFNPEDIIKALVNGGVKRKGEWLKCSAREAAEAYETVRKGEHAPVEGKRKHKKSSDKDPKRSHPSADALDWEEAISLIRRLYVDERYRDAMLVASGCYLGLRISDLLTLRWGDMRGASLSLEEKKTGKTRYLRLNRNFMDIAAKCREGLCDPPDEDYIISSTQSEESRPITRQRASQILTEMKTEYSVKSAKVFSTHSLRKTFGRRVWMQECEKGRGDQALLLLSDVFGHSSVTITKRYLGIRKEEILSVYDAL